MAARPETLLRYIRRLVIRPEPDECTDAGLLERFISAKDERAFAKLVERHGPLVLQVCWRVLGNIDLYNVFNASPIQTDNTRYGAAWLTPTQILDARLFKIGAQVSF